jgi:hypothetical protein
MASKKQNQFKYGIEITKPWSKEMYDHNDKVAEIVKQNIEKALFEIFKDGDEKSLREISKSVCAHGFGDGYSFEDIYNETMNDLDMAQNYWLNDIYDDIVSDGFAPKLDVFFIGY